MVLVVGSHQSGSRGLLCSAFTFDTLTVHHITIHTILAHYVNK